MNTTVSVILTYDEKIKQWGAWLHDIAAYGQGGSPQEAIDDLKEALALYIEVVGKKKFLQEISPPVQTISLPLATLV
jgi:predicted RNase H-like HicB family nuclease